MNKLSTKGPFARFVAWAVGLVTLPTLLVGCNAASKPSTELDEEYAFKQNSALTSLGTCDAYKAYLIKSKAVDYAIAHYYPDLGYQLRVPKPQIASLSASKAAREYGTTNLQQADVDEIDMLKNDGSHLYVLENKCIRILKAWPVDALQELIKIEFVKEEGYDAPIGNGLLLLDKRLIVFRTSYKEGGSYHPYVPGGPALDFRRESTFQLDVYDVTKPETPILLQNSRFDGDFKTARVVNGRIYVVMNIQTTVPDFDRIIRRDLLASSLPGLKKGEDLSSMSDEKRQSYIDKAIPMIIEFLNEKTAELNIETLLPVYAQDKGGNLSEHMLLSCQNIYIPQLLSQRTGLMSIIEFSGDDYSQIYATALADGASIVYASKENIFAVSSRISWYWQHASSDDRKTYSHIHRFNYGGLNGHIQYVNSGTVEGAINDAFWMNEHKGYLRVATQEHARSNIKGSSLSILSLDGPELKQIGRIDGIAPGERIFASHLFGDKGYLVTYKQSDPLFTLDLSTPEAPKIVGELKINGYSSYIHPLGEDALLTISKDADDEGREKGLQLQIFDVSDMAKPKRSHQWLIATDKDASASSSAALNDYHVFSFHAPSGLLAIPMSIYHWKREESKLNISAMVMVKVNQDTGFEELGHIDHAEFKKDPKESWDRLKRSRFMFSESGVYDKNAYIYTLSALGIKINNAHQPSEEISKLAFEK